MYNLLEVDQFGDSYVIKTFTNQADAQREADKLNATMGWDNQSWEVCEA